MEVPKGKESKAFGWVVMQKGFLGVHRSGVLRGDTPSLPPHPQN